MTPKIEEEFGLQLYHFNSTSQIALIHQLEEIHLLQCFAILLRRSPEQAT
jgi:hypothetical protein